MAEPILFQRGLLLAKIEGTFGVDASPTATDDAFLVRNPDFSPDITQLDRSANVRNSLSQLKTKPGRKVANISFGYEVRGSGVTDASTAPRLGTLLRACGYNETAIDSASATIGTVNADAGNTGTVTWSKTTQYDGTLPRTVTITASTSGGSGIAEVDITAPAVGDLGSYSATGVVVTDSTPVTLPGGAEITPTVGTDLGVGDVWTVNLTPSGHEYSPVSESFESCTIYIYYDGLLHKMTGCVGTFTVEANGGDYAILNFNFTGNYVAPEDAAQPSGTFEDVEPNQVEWSALSLDGDSSLVASQFSIDAGNDITIREDVNKGDSYSGARITGRSPTISFNPETVTEATFDFWNKLEQGTVMDFTSRVGVDKGNVVRFTASSTQINDLGYSDRNNTRAYDVNLFLSGDDDELKIHIG